MKRLKEKRYKKTKKNMPDYSQAKIYKLTCDDPELIYYGATTKPYISHRLAQHKNQYKKGEKLTKSKLLFDAGNVKIELVESFPCKDINQLNARESYYVRNYPCVNRCIPGRTTKERYEDNRELILKQVKEYYEENKEKIKEKHKEYYEENKKKYNEKITCECGCEVLKRHLARHRKTKKHINLMNKKNL